MKKLSLSALKWMPLAIINSDQVDRMKSTIKETLSKTMTTSFKWPNTLPIVLYSIQSTPHASPPLTAHQKKLLRSAEYVNKNN